MNNRLFAVWLPAGESLRLFYVGSFIDANTVAANEKGALLRPATRQIAALYNSQKANRWIEETQRLNIIHKHHTVTNEHGLETKKWWILHYHAWDGERDRVICKTEADAQAMLAELRPLCYEASYTYGQYYS